MSAMFCYSVVSRNTDKEPRLVETTWLAFVASLAAPTPRGRPLEEYLASDEDKKKRLKDGPAAIFATFDGKGRLDKNVVKITAIGLDFDKGTPRKAIESRLNGYTYVAHSTYSHSDALEKWRVVVPFAEPAPTERLPLVVNHFESLFNGEIDEACKNPSRLFYLPACPPDAVDQYETFSQEGELFDPAVVQITPILAESKPLDRASILQGVDEGSRDKSIFKLICSYRDRGLLREEAERLALAAAANCRPPFPAKEVSAKVKSVYERYAPGAQDIANAVILPSDHVPFTEAAAAIFPRFAERQQLFIRGGAIVELIRTATGPELELIRAEAFRSRLESLGQTWRHSVDRGKTVLRQARCPTDTAKALLETREARDLLPPIRLVSAEAMLALIDEEPITLGPGYNAAAGGVLVVGQHLPEVVPLAEAVQALRGLLRDFDFVSPGDESRAVAAMITPALAMGQFLDGPTPVDVREADHSQSGKGFGQEIVRAIYGEHAYPIAQRQGGVGSVDESLSAALLSGRVFVTVDNVRGRFDSQFIEMILTWRGHVAARVPHRGEVKVDASGITFMLTSNGVETTPDLANRSSIVRIRKQRPGYAWHAWPEGGLVAHVRARQPFYLGAVHAVVLEWVKQGRQQSPNVDHDFRVWGGVLDWIVSQLFDLAPLMEGHRVVQVRVANRALTWLREVGLAVFRARRDGEYLSATELFALCEQEGIELPGAAKELDAERGRQRVGLLMGQAFRSAEHDRLEIDGLVVRRCEESHYNEARQENTIRRVYVFGDGGDLTCAF